MSVVAATSRASGVRRRLQAVSGGRYSLLSTLLLLLPLLLLLILAFYLPIVRFLGRSLFDPGLTLDNYQHLLDRPLYGTILRRTLWTAVVVSVSALVLGYPIAYLMATLRGWRLVVVAAVVVLPLWVSVLVRTYAWTVVLGRNGIVNQVVTGLGLSDQPLKLLNTEVAVWIAMTHILLPMMVLPIYSSLRGIPRDITRSAQSLGADWPAVIRHVILPLSLPGVAAGLVLVFIISLGFFITPMLVGGPSTMMIGTLITEQATRLLDWPLASAIAAVLLVVTLAIMVVFNRVLRLDRVLGDG